MTSRSRCENVAITSFGGKCQNLQMSFTSFCASSYRFRDIQILNFWRPKSRSRSQSEIFSIIRRQRSKFTNVSHTFFVCYFLPFQRYEIFNFLPPKSRSRSRSAILAITPFDGKYQHLQTSFFIYFFIFVKVWPLRITLTDRHNDGQTQKRTNRWLQAKSCRFA